MKKIFTLLAASFLAVTSFAQTDIAVDEVQYYTDANSEYLYGNAGPVSIVWSNQGATINAGDTVFAFIFINDAFLTAPGFIAQQDIPSGTVDTLNYHATTSLDQTTFYTRLTNLGYLASSSLTIGGTPVGANREIKAYVLVYRLGNNGVADTDVNTANDTGSVSYDLVQGDFSTANLEVASPAGVVNASNEIDLGNTIDSVSFDWTNNAAQSFYHYISTFELSVDGALDTISVILPRGATTYGAYTGYVNPSATIGVTLPIDASALPSTTVGDFDVCVRTLYSDDADATNDQVCETYTYVNSTGIQDMAAASVKSYFANDVLNITVENMNGTQDVNVTNVSGQIVYTGKVNNGLNQVNIDDVAGVYFVTVGDNTQKIVKL
ncbi:MAG: hypothetical protein CL843_15360 [Crocinitomicaceae bacterium]|nr:hypothetical protein [Crocinitomicaceae bacterium]|tara:strand:+ start:146 stop:1285 length:1140 start_codon:yes stop_codon:yes gene_type:complete